MKKFKVEIFAEAYEEISKVNISNNDLEQHIEEFIDDNKVLIIKNFLSKIPTEKQVNTSKELKDAEGAYLFITNFNGKEYFLATMLLRNKIK